MKQSHAEDKVELFINGLPTWQKNICRQIRQLIHKAEPEIEETIKRGDRPYFILQGNVCALQATKDHINVCLGRG